MKKMKIFLASFVAFAYAMSMSSCSDDKDTPASPAAEKIQGSYMGDLECSVMGNVSTFEGKNFSITTVDESTVTVTLPQFGESPMDMPSIKVTGVRVTESEGVVTMATTEVNGVSDTGKSYTCTFTGFVDGETLNIKYNLQYGAMPMPLICNATAIKQ